MAPAMIRFCFAAFLVLLCFRNHCAWAAAILPEDSGKAVILAYHRIGEDASSGTNLSTEQFSAHMREIRSGGYTVLPLDEILEALQSGAALPPRTLAITFEGAYLSAYKNAIKPLLEENIPFTVFYASDTIDRKLPEYIGWDKLKKLKKNRNVTIGVLPAAYAHTAHLSRNEMIGNLNRARQRFRDVFGSEADFLSYPFGEYSLELRELAKTQGFKYALGLHSGAVHAGSDFHALPRFSMTGHHGDIERFQLIATALPLPAADLEPLDPFLQKEEWVAGFTLPEALENESSSLSCYISGQKQPAIQRLGRRIEIRSAEAERLPARIRMNCTMPGPASEEDKKPRWRWLGAIYHWKESGENSGKTAAIPPQDELPELQE